MDELIFQINISLLAAMTVSSFFGMIFMMPIILFPLTMLIFIVSYLLLESALLSELNGMLYRNFYKQIDFLKIGELYGKRK